MIMPIGAEGTVGLDGEHYCDVCAMTLPKERGSADGGEFTAITGAVTSAAVKEPEQQPQVVVIHRPGGETPRHQYSPVTLVMVAGAAGALMAGVLVGAFFIFAKPSQVAAPQPKVQLAPVLPQPLLAVKEAPKTPAPSGKVDPPPTPAAKVEETTKAGPPEPVNKVTVHPVNHPPLLRSALAKRLACFLSWADESPPQAQGMPLSWHRVMNHSLGQAADIAKRQRIIDTKWTEIR
jgi:hypothetical protein